MIDLNVDQIMEQFGGFDFSPEQVDAIANMVLFATTAAKLKEVELLGTKYGIDEQELELRRQQLIFEESEKLPFERDKMEFQRQMQELQMQSEQARFENQEAIGAQNLEQSKFQTLNQMNAYNSNLMSGAINREQATGNRFLAGAGAARANPLGF